MRHWFVVACLLAAPATAQEFTTLKGHGGPIMGIAVAGSGQVATASFDNSLGLWTGRSPAWLEGHDAAVTTLTHWNGGLLSGGDDYRLLYWPGASAPAQEVTRHQGKISQIAAMDDVVASASWDGAIHVVETDAAASDFGDPKVLTGHAQSVNALGFAPNGTLYSASADGTIRTWNLETGDNRIIVKHGFGINRMVLDPEGQWLAYGAVDGVTRIIDLATEKEVRDLSLERRPILALAHHAPTGQLAVGDGEGYIMMVDTTRWRITRDFRATRAGPIWALAFSTDGQMIYAGGLDDVAYGWPIEMLGEIDPTISGARGFLKDPETMTNGERQFMRKCSICHATDPGPSRKAGPTLSGVFGRAAGAVPGYPYSPILQDADIIWDETTIDALFDEGPDHYIPGSKMPMQVIAGANDRADLIAWLRTATTQEAQTQDARE